MTEPVATVATALRGLAAGAPVVLAVSGGPDSVGMAELVTAARPDLRAAVVHVRHGLRDDADDARIAVDHARRLGLPWRVVAVEVREAGTGPEDAARRARWRALGAAAARFGAGVVCTGHTADDQAETVLLNLARGSGLPGLAGMPARRPLTDDIDVVRPVLELRRAQVRAVAERCGHPLAVDPSNEDRDQRRARARHGLLPELAALTGGGTDPVVALARLAGHAARDTAALDAIAAQRLETATLRWGPVAAVDSRDLDVQPAAVATRMVRGLLAAAGAPRPDEATVDAVLAMADGRSTTLPGGYLATRGGGLLAVGPAGVETSTRTLDDDDVTLTEIGVAVRRGVELSEVTLPPWAPPAAARVVPVRARTPLTVRAWRTGDRIVTAAGTQRVADAMADARVPRVARGLVPVVEDDLGILWVPGVGVRRDAAGDRRLGLVRAGGQ